MGVRTELVNSEDQDGLVDLESKDLGLDEGKRLSVDLNDALSGLEKTVSIVFECALDRGSGCVPCSGRQLLAKLLALLIQHGDLAGGKDERTSRSLLLAEALHALGSHDGRLCVGRAVKFGGRRICRLSRS